MTGEDAEDAEDRIDELESALHHIVQWANAYPLDIFPEPDWRKAAKLLNAGGITLDSVAAGVARHVVTGIGEIARRALSEDAESNIN
jgi:hypothetical protein